MVFPSLGDVWKLRDCAWQYYVAMLVATVAVLIPFVLREEPDMMGRTISVQPKFVTDGNTFYGTMAGEGKMVRLRLRLVDAPEMDQPYGREARLFLRHMLVDDAPAEVMCRVTGTDGWGGLIVDVVTRHSPSRAGNDDD
ncbi:hypothetical protein DQ04_01841070, partial [Trypanosoma grayi]|uniref:hypothetical protein n=1 Tax=Trypanosoma grayi TaxID=71804 RepID=UPI0004F468D5